MIAPGAAYYTVMVPYAERYATEWHPTTRVGPFSTLVRGAFSTREDAIEWGRKHLNGTPYRVDFVPGESVEIKEVR